MGFQPTTLIGIFSSQDQQIDRDCWPTELVLTFTYGEITLVRFTKRNFKQGAENVYDIKHGSEAVTAVNARARNKKSRVRDLSAAQSTTWL